MEGRRLRTNNAAPRPVAALCLTAQELGRSIVAGHRPWSIRPRSAANSAAIQCQALARGIDGREQETCRNRSLRRRHPPRGWPGVPFAGPRQRAAGGRRPSSGWACPSPGLVLTTARTRAVGESRRQETPVRSGCGICRATPPVRAVRIVRCQQQGLGHRSDECHEGHRTVLYPIATIASETRLLSGRHDSTPCSLRARWSSWGSASHGWCSIHSGVIFAGSRSDVARFERGAENPPRNRDRRRGNITGNNLGLDQPETKLGLLYPRLVVQHLPLALPQ